jgi:hypothetical protein
MDPSTTIQAFDAFLTRRDLALDAVIVGGTALGLLGIVSRPTRDCDVLHPLIPVAVRQAAQDFARECRRAGEVLADDWLNDGPASLVRDLPVGWEDRLQIAYRGEAVTLRTLGRLDLLRTKVFALCDRAIDLPDCLALCPTEAELEELLPWLEKRDANPDWPAHARETLADLNRRLRHGL